jgi:hypothetical protein
MIIQILIGAAIVGYSFGVEWGFASLVVWALLFADSDSNKGLR